MSSVGLVEHREFKSTANSKIIKLLVKPCLGNSCVYINVYWFDAH